MNHIENIDELIGKFLSGEASPEEAMLLEDWKSQSSSNLVYFEKCEKIFSNPTEVDTTRAWQKVKPQLSPSGKLKSIRPFTSYMRIAASIALLIGLGGLIMYLVNGNQNGETAYVADITSKQVQLSDGSDIIIAPHSSVIAENNFGKKERVLHLKGSAYFSVVHDQYIPFVVDAGGVFIKDIGTKFNIVTSLDTDTIHVHVDEGIVLLFDSLGSEIEVTAGKNAWYIKSRKKIIDPEKISAQPNQFNFSKNTLEDIMKHLNEAYKANIIIEKEGVKKCTITTQFSNEKLETILSVITETLGLTYEKTDKGYIIKGDQCMQ